MRVILYGCGMRAKNILKSYKGHVSFVGIADKDYLKAERLGTEEGLLAYDCNRISCSYDYIVVSSALYYDEIKKELIQKGIDSSLILSVKELDGLLLEDSADRNKKCIICGSKIFDWIYCGQDEELFRSMNVIGAGIRRGVCPACGCIDRTRYVYKVLRDSTDIFSPNKSILHFAPERELERILRKSSKDYVTADICPGKADEIVDITDIRYESNRFDYIICNHILEHVKEEKRALSECYRCLKKGGKLILTMPICWAENTFELDKVTTEEENIMYYGQRDHVRLYGKDIVKRISWGEFCIRRYSADEILREEIERNGFIEGDSVFVCTKN